MSDTPRIPKSVGLTYEQWACLNRLDMIPKWEKLWHYSQHDVRDIRTVPRNTALLIMDNFGNLFWGVTCSKTSKGRSRAIVGDNYIFIDEFRCKLPCDILY